MLKNPYLCLKERPIIMLIIPKNKTKTALFSLIGLLSFFPSTADSQSPDVAYQAVIGDAAYEFKIQVTEQGKRSQTAEEKGKHLAQLHAFHSEICATLLPEDPEISQILQSMGMTYQGYFDYLFAELSNDLERLQMLAFTYFVWKRLLEKDPDLKKKWKDKWFVHLIRLAPNAEIRQLFVKIRLLYTYSVYSMPAFNHIAGVQELNRMVNAEKGQESYPKKPTIQYSNGEITALGGGVIDYVIIGSGPAASTIAHELTKKNKMLKSLS